MKLCFWCSKLMNVSARLYVFAALSTIAIALAQKMLTALGLPQDWPSCALERMARLSNGWFLQINRLSIGDLRAARHEIFI
jgi:hypothetical protein